MTPVELRRALHRHPELSFREEASARLIRVALEAAGIAAEPIAGTGVLATVRGRSSGKAVVLRADIDALPITETVTCEWRSENEGVMHACGHDLHAAMLYGALLRLAAEPDFDGTVLGVFQPGEECNPGGATRVLKEPFWDAYEIKAVVGQHVDPALEVGCLGFRAGQYMAANDELRIHVQGRGGHGALRGEHADTVLAAAEMVRDLVALNSSRRVVSIGRVEALGATNVIPDAVKMEGTVRSFSESDRAALKREILERVAALDKQHGVQTFVQFTPGYPSVCSDPALVSQAEALARGQGLETCSLALRPTSDDFGFYAQKYPALYYRIGVGAASGSLHTAAFNPSEEAIETGANFMALLAQKMV